MTGFFLAMVIGRIGGGWLAPRVEGYRFLLMAFGLASIGFPLFWLARTPALNIAGLALGGCWGFRMSIRSSRRSRPRRGRRTRTSYSRGSCSPVPPRFCWRRSCSVCSAIWSASKPHLECCCRCCWARSSWLRRPGGAGCQRADAGGSVTPSEVREYLLAGRSSVTRLGADAQHDVLARNSAHRARGRARTERERSTARAR